MLTQVCPEKEPKILLSMSGTVHSHIEMLTVKPVISLKFLNSTAAVKIILTFNIL